MDRAAARLRAGIGLILLAAIGLAAVVAPWLATHDPRQAMPDAQLQPPSWAHPCGTDYLGRDVYSRALYGGRRTLGAALLAGAVALGPGLAVGLVAGYAGRWLDGALMRLLDALLAIPALLLALALVALLGSGMAPIAVAVGVAGFPAYARVTRAAVRQARAQPFVEAARAVGRRPVGIVLWHIVPNSAGTLIAFAGVTLSWAILNSAALTFLGYGGDIAAPDWGMMLAEGRQTFRVAPWVPLAPGVLLSLAVWALNQLAAISE